MTRKILIKISILFLTFFGLFFGSINGKKAFGAAEFGDSTMISKGVLIQAYPVKTISSAAINEGDFVYFVNPVDLWVYEVNVLPKNTFFRGYVEMLKMPVKGVNAAIVIRITEVILPDGTIKRMSASVTQNGNDRLGGTLTPPASYNKTVHPREGQYWKRAGVLQYVPSGDYEMGMHFTLPTNKAVFIRLDEDYDSASDGINKEDMFQ